MYVAVRRDLSAAQQVVQSVHAAIEIRNLQEKFSEHPSVIVLGVKSEESLVNFKNYAEEKGFFIKEFHEPDIDDEMTSVAVFPVREDQKEKFKKFQLLK